MMAPFGELAPMTAEEALARRVKINHAVQWVWRVLVIVIVLFQMVNLLISFNNQDSTRKALNAQSKAIAYLVDVTVDKQTIDPKTGQATPWIVEIYQRLVGVIHADEEARDRMVSEMQSYTQLGEERQKKNEELVSAQKEDTQKLGHMLEQFKNDIESDMAGERADRDSWAKALLESMMKVEQSSAVVKRKVEQKIINPSDVAPVYHANRILRKQNQQLKEKKKPVIKIWPWQ